jgi:hypothetical protein
MARWALTAETRAQNAWHNFRDGVQNLTLAQRGYASQKAALPPVNYTLTGNATVDAPMVEFISTLSDKDKLGSLPAEAKLSLRTAQEQEIINAGKERQKILDLFSPELKTKLNKSIEADKNAEGILVGRFEGKEQQRLKSIDGRAESSYVKAYENDFPIEDITAASVRICAKREGR